MKGAVERIKRERAMVWFGAMLPLSKKPPTFDDFVGGVERPIEPASFLNMRLSSAAKGLRGITMAEHRKSVH